MRKGKRQHRVDARRGRRLSLFGLVPVRLEHLAHQCLAPDERDLAVHVLLGHASDRRARVGVRRHDDLGAVGGDHERRGGAIASAPASTRRARPSRKPPRNTLQDELPPAVQDREHLTPGDLVGRSCSTSERRDRQRLDRQRIADVLLHEEVDLRDLRARDEDDVERLHRHVDTRIRTALDRSDVDRACRTGDPRRPRGSG